MGRLVCSKKDLDGLSCRKSRKSTNNSKHVLYQRKNSDLGVEIFYVDKDPWLILLTKTWSSEQLCVATWDCMYCCFPKSLIDQKAIRFFVCSTPGQQKSREGFLKRKYTELTAEHCLSLDEFTHDRWIGDGLSRLVRFLSAPSGVCEALKKYYFRCHLNGVIVHQ